MIPAADTVDERPAVSVPSDEELATFVWHSQKIEREPTDSDHPLVRDHLAAAARVVTAAVAGRRPSPRAIHRRLMRSEPEQLPGQYRRPHGRRSGGVSVDGHAKANWRKVPGRMQRLLRHAQYVVSSVTARPLPAELWELHHELEVIHPFFDGNGRTGRLWLNALRLRAGYPWLTVLYEERFDYYEMIRCYERRGRKPWTPRR